MQTYQRDEQYVEDIIDDAVEVFDEQIDIPNQLVIDTQLIVDDQVIVDTQIIVDPYGNEVLVEQDVYIGQENIIQVDTGFGEIYIEQPVALEQPMIDLYVEQPVVEVFVEQPIVEVYVQEATCGQEQVIIQTPVVDIAFDQNEVILDQIDPIINVQIAGEQIIIEQNNEVVIIEQADDVLLVEQTDQFYQEPVVQVIIQPAFQVFVDPVVQVFVEPVVEVLIQPMGQAYIQPMVQVCIQQPQIQVYQQPIVEVYSQNYYPQPIINLEPVIDVEVFGADQIVVQNNYGTQVILDTGFGDQVIVQQPFYGGQEEVIIETPFYGGGEVIIETPFCGEQEVIIETPFYGGGEVIIETPFCGEQEVIIETPFYGGGEVIIETPFCGEQEVIIETPFYGGQVVIQQPFYGGQVIIQQPYYGQQQVVDVFYQEPYIIVNNKQDILDIVQNKILNPQFNSFANCKQLYIPQTMMLSEEFFTYKQTYVALCYDHLHLGNEMIPLSQVDKVKAFPEHVHMHEKFYKIKVSHFGSNKFIAAQSRPKVNQLVPEHFKWFSNLIVSRLIHRGVSIPGQIKNDENPQISAKLNNVMVGGHIFKRSKYLKKWQKRYTVISNEGLFSYRNVTDSSFSYSIKASSVKYLWTRFDMLEPYVLIVKIMHTNHEKTEFGIPLMNFTITERHNWLYQFYRLMMHGNGISIEA